MKKIPLSLILALVLVLSFGTFASANTSLDSIIRCCRPHDGSTISNGIDIQVSAMEVSSESRRVLTIHTNGVK